MANERTLVDAMKAMDPNVKKLGEGVWGHELDEGESGIYYPVIAAERPGTGDVGRWLDALPTNRTIKFPTVISAKLAMMLERRGYVLLREWAEEFNEFAEVWTRAPRAEGDRT